jgi:hypothetical protein
LRKVRQVDKVSAMPLTVWEQLRRHFQGAAWRPFATVLFIEILFALALLRSPGTPDVPGATLGWMAKLSEHGLVKGYGVIAKDYPPFTSIILLLVAKVGVIFSLDFFLSFKVSLLVALLCSTFCFWAWTLDAALTALLAFSFLLNGVALGYLDTYFTPFFILSLWALQQKRIWLFGLLFAVSSLIKWQPLIVGPFLFLHALSSPKPGPNHSPGRAVWLHLIGPTAAVVLCALLAFGIREVWAAFHFALNHRFLSGHALNFHWLTTYFLRLYSPDQYGPLTDGIVTLIDYFDSPPTWVQMVKLLFVLCYLGAFWRLIKFRSSFQAAIELSLVGYLAYFIFNTGVHENHLFLATILATAAAALSPDKRLRAVLIVAISNLNLITFYGLTGNGLASNPVVWVDVTLLFSAVNVVLFLLLWGDLVLRAGDGSKFGFRGLER